MRKPYWEKPYLWITLIWRKIDLKNRLAADLGKAIAVLVLILIILMPSFIGKMSLSWWSVKYKCDGLDSNLTADFCYTGSAVTENASLIKIYKEEEIIKYNEAGLKHTSTTFEIIKNNETDLEHTSSVFEFVKTMLIVGMVIIVGVIVCCIITAKKKLPVKVTMLISLIAFVILIIAPVYLMLKLPTAFNDDFQENTNLDPDINFIIGSSPGNQTSENEQDTVNCQPSFWMPQIGWILSLIVPILALNIVTGINKNKKSYTYIPKNRADLLYQQKQNHSVDSLMTQPPANMQGQSYQSQEPIQQAQPQEPQLPPGMTEFKPYIEEDLDESRIEQIHYERIKMLNEVKAESDLDDMLDDYNLTKSKMEEDEEAYERELSIIASKKQFDIKDLVNLDKNLKNKSYCPKCNGELDVIDDNIICSECGAKFRQKT